MTRHILKRQAFPLPPARSEHSIGLFLLTKTWYDWAMNDYKITNEQKTKISEILRENGAVVGYLFGSYSRGTAGALSDLDVGLIFPKSTAETIQEEKIEKMRSELERVFGRDKVDIVNVSALQNPLLRYIIVLGEGQVLFNDNAGLHNEISALALREYEDTRALRSVQRAALNNLFV